MTVRAAMVAVAVVLASGCGGDDTEGSGPGGDSSTAGPSTSGTNPTSTGSVSPSSSGTDDSSTGTEPDGSSTGPAADSSSGSSEVTGVPRLSFAPDIEPILLDNCGCHIGAGAPGGLVLLGGEAYANLVGVPSQQLPTMARVAPGEPSQSYFLHKLRGTHEDAGGGGFQMPRGASPLSDDDQRLVRDWIRGGAEP